MQDCTKAWKAKQAKPSKARSNDEVRRLTPPASQQHAHVPSPRHQVPQLNFSERDIDWSNPLTCQLELQTGGLQPVKDTMKKLGGAANMRRRMTTAQQMQEEYLKEQQARRTREKLAHDQKLQNTRQRLNMKFASHDKQNNDDDGGESKLQQMLTIADSLSKIQARGKSTHEQTEGQGSGANSTAAAGAVKAAPQAPQAPQPAADEEGKVSVEYTPGCAIYYGSTVAIEAHHGSFLCLDSGRSCKASAKGYEPHARFTIWNLDNLNSTGTLRYGDAVWLQCGRHEILGSSVMMIDVAAAWEKEIRQYEIRSQKHATSADPHTDRPGSKAEQGDTDGTEDDAQQQQEEKPLARSRRGGNTRDRRGNNRAGRRRSVIDGAVVAAATTGANSEMGQTESKEPKWVGRAVAVHCSGKSLKRAKHVGRWVLMRSYNPQEAMGQEVGHLDELVIEQELAYLASKTSQIAGLRQDANSQKSTLQIQKARSTSSLASASTGDLVRERVGSEGGLDEPFLTELRAGDEENQKMRKNQEEERLARERERDEARTRLLQEQNRNRVADSDTTWKLHLVKLASNAHHEEKRQALASKARRQLRNSATRRVEVSVASARLRAERTRETEYLNKVQMIPCERRAKKLAHHFDKRYRDKASRGWQPENMSGRHHVSRVNTPKAMLASPSSSNKRALKKSQTMATQSLGQAENLEELKILTTALTMQLAIKSDVYNALGNQTNAQKVQQRVKRMGALRVISRAFKVFRNKRWQRRFKDVDRKLGKKAKESLAEEGVKGDHHLMQQHAPDDAATAADTFANSGRKSKYAKRTGAGFLAARGTGESVRRRNKKSNPNLFSHLPRPPSREEDLDNDIERRHSMADDVESEPSLAEPTFEEGRGQIEGPDEREDLTDAERLQLLAHISPGIFGEHMEQVLAWTQPPKEDVPRLIDDGSMSRGIARGGSLTIEDDGGDEAFAEEQEEEEEEAGAENEDEEAVRVEMDADVRRAFIGEEDEDNVVEVDADAGPGDDDSVAGITVNSIATVKTHESRWGW